MRPQAKNALPLIFLVIAALLFFGFQQIAEARLSHRWKGTTHQNNSGIAFINGTVITMSDQGVLENHTVLVKGGSIIGIGPSESLTVPNDFEVIDAQGKFLMPGLTDMHVHLSDPEDLASNLRYGVTSALQMSGQRGIITDFIGLRNQIEAGEVAGPRLYLTGPMFDRLGLSRQTTAYATTAEQVPDVLKKHIEAGYDFIKVHNQTPGAIYQFLTQNSSIPVIGHIPNRVSIKDGLNSQVMTAHSTIFYYKTFYDYRCKDGFWECMTKVEIDMSKIEGLVQQISASGVYVTANLVYLATEQSNDDDWQAVLDDPEFQQLGPSLQARWRRDNPIARGASRPVRRQDIDKQKPFNYELIKALNKAGVPILAGTDMGVEGIFPGRSIHKELLELVAAGLSTLDALKTATSTPGQFFRKYVPRSPDLGHMKVGYTADLLLLNANPLEDINNTQNINGVMSRGRWYTVEDLDEMRKRQK